ncbi:Spindle pole body component alp14 [Neolecta irregularis DAH-3]|uniref:Spindle pole body component alp14 n=1 Tax=Neolecta irregularis (strain DAH-3) TaxID=1198029 RepID=A0A1U7LRK1_NEOID|nr:Spindle pole body component alp14 [Neolecta irregularis DAH-3]|eukprot:OLL25274.1 Spindle pole body component alp14 [Neolecta irregularis DAH-3]
MADPEDYSALPITDRALHKVWKVRLAAYDEAAKAFAISTDEADPCFRPWLDPVLWKKIVTDSNVVAQEAGLAALLVFLEFAGPLSCSRTRAAVVPSIVDKCLGATRAGTRQKTIDVLLMYVELDIPDPVVEDLIPGLAAKQPKTVAASALALREIYRLFGAKTVNPKLILKHLPKIFAHSDKNVRAEGQALTMELYRWLGDALRPSLSELKPLQIKELDAAFESLEPGKPAQSRFLRSQKQTDAASQGLAGYCTNSHLDDADEESDQIDVFDLSEPIDVLSKVPKDLADNLASPKWKERKDALDALYAVANVPRIQDADYSDISRILAKCMKDANIAVVTVAAQCIQVLATGLRANFARYKGTVLSPMIEKLKERKQTVVDALASAMDAVFSSSSLTDVMEEINEGLKHKNPQVKQESLKFLVRCLRTTTICPSKADQKTIADHGVILLGDTAEPVRAAAADCLGTLMKILGERAMGPYLENVEEMRKAKIKECFGQAQVKAKPEKLAPVKAAPPPKPGIKKLPAKGLKAPVKKAPSTADDSESTRPSSKMSIAASSDSASKTKSALAKPSASKGVPVSRIARPGSVSSPAKAAFSNDGSECSRPPTPKTNLVGRGLASRPLGMASKAPTPVQDTPSNSVAEKAELEQLRLEKAAWVESQKKQGNQIQEITSLQLKNAELIEQHTNDMLNLKMNENYVSRAKNDIERFQTKITSLEKSLEAAKARRSSQAPSETLDSGLWKDRAEKAERLLFEKESLIQLLEDRRTATELELNSLRQGQNLKQTVNFMESRWKTLEEQNIRLLCEAEANSKLVRELQEERAKVPRSSISSSNGISTRDRASCTSPSLPFDVNGEEKENSRFSPVPGKYTSPVSSASPTLRNQSGESSIQSWKRAAEVTAQLKARIEQMKRQDSNGVPGR